jgi:osmotically-inducible protein OsmY
MKKIQVCVAAVATLVAAVSFDAWSQNGQPSANAASAASGAAAPANNRKTNRALRRQIYAAIGKNKEINAGDISVIAKGGAVTLSGTVNDAAQIATVGEIAKSVPGVTSVTNKLTVSKPLGGM